MSDRRTEVELSLVEMLKTAAGLETVKTFENSIRECLFTGEKLTLGFRTEELPAIAVSAQLKPTKSSMFSAGERQHEVPVSLTIITRAQRKKEALAKAADLQDAVDRVLAAARKSGNSLGDNTLVIGDVTSSATAIDERPYSFAISTTEFTILKVVEL
jgi:hypothetical protein